MGQENAPSYTVASSVFRGAHPTRRSLLAVGAAVLQVVQSHAVKAALALTTSGTVFTADERGGSISAITLPSGRVETVSLPIMPHNVQVAPGGGIVLLVGMGMKGGHGTHGTGHLLVLDAQDIARPPLMDIGVGPHPAHVVTDASGARAFVTDSQANIVLVINLGTGRVEREVAVGTYPHGLRLSPDGSELFVANMRGGDVSVIDLATLSEVARIGVGKAPVQVGFTPDGALVFVSLSGENRVAIIDRARRVLTATVPVGRNPVQLQATTDGRFVYVANQGTAVSPADTVSVIDVAQRLVATTIKSGRGAHGVTISADGRLILVSNIVDSTVAVLDVATQTRLAIIKVGAGPNGISFRNTG